MIAVEHAPDALPRRRSGVVVQTDGEHVTLRDVGRGRTYIVNDTALAIWEQCDGETTPEEIVRGISALFDAPSDVIAGDVERGLGELTAAQLLEWAERSRG